PANNTAKRGFSFSLLFVQSFLIGFFVHSFTSLVLIDFQKFWLFLGFLDLIELIKVSFKMVDFAFSIHYLNILELGKNRRIIVFYCLLNASKIFSDQRPILRTG